MIRFFFRKLAWAGKVKPFIALWTICTLVMGNIAWCHLRAGALEYYLQYFVINLPL